MFTQLDRTDLQENDRRNGNRRWTASQLVSLAVHCAVLYLLIRQPEPIFVQPSSTLHGNNGTSTTMVFLPSDVARSYAAPPASERLTAPVLKPRQQPKPAPKPAIAKDDQPTGASAESASAGSPFGTMSYGLSTGHEVKPALPVVFPDPAVARSELPSGVQGDVVIEVTIDARGNIVQTKVLKTLGYGLENKVLAALQNWRFTPATQDGVAIASQQYVYFHFPS
jgi:TonB family protein